MPKPFISFDIDLTDLVPTDVDIHDAARTVLDRHRQDVENDVKANIPSPTRELVHVYATGRMLRSIDSRVTDADGNLRLTVESLVPYAGYADEGYTRTRGRASALSWAERGRQAHGDTSYMGTVAARWLDKLGREIVKEIAARRAQKEARRG